MIADGQIAITPDFAGEEQHMARTVHCLQGELFGVGELLLFFVVVLHLKHVRAVVLPVAGGFPQRLVEDDGRLYFHVAGGEEDLAHVVGQGVPENRALLQPERGARRPRVKEKQPQLAPQLTVVTFLRFLHACEVRLELVLAEERRAVHALHRLISCVAFPIRIRRAEQLEPFESAGGRHMRAHAEVDEGVLSLIV